MFLNLTQLSTRIHENGSENVLHAFYVFDWEVTEPLSCCYNFSTELGSFRTVGEASKAGESVT